MRRVNTYIPTPFLEVSYDPCPKCRYFGLCDSDDCAMHGFRLDSKVSLKHKRYE